MMCPHSDNCENQAKNDDGNQINASKSCIDKKCHDHRADQGNRCTDAHAQQHLICILQVGHVGGKTGDKSGRAEFVNVGKRKGLYIFIHCFSKVACKSCRSAGPIFSTHRSGKQRNTCNNDHTSAHDVNMVDIPGFYAVIDDRCHHQWDDCFHEYF